MAIDNDTKPYDALMLLCGRYEALCDVLWNYLGHDSSALPLLQGLNEEFDRLLKDLSDQGVFDEP